MTEKPNPEITLRSPTADELRDFYAPVVVAFGSDFSEAEYLAEAPLFEPERLVNAFDGEERVAGGGAFSMRLSLPGGARIPVSGITAVGVRPDHTRRGILRQMMAWLFDDARKHHEPVAILLASEAAIYQRFGFGNATLQSHFEVDRDAGRLPLTAPGVGRRADPDGRYR